MNEFNEASYQGHYIQLRVCWGAVWIWFELSLTPGGYYLKYFHNILIFYYVEKKTFVHNV